MNEHLERGASSPEELAQRYPILYSQKLMDEWEALFDERAMVIRTEKGKPLVCMGIHEAMPEQREYAAENQHLHETWEQVEIHRYGNIAVIKADYDLAVDHETRKGRDVLTLIREQDRWLILNLTYEQTEHIRR